MKSIDPFLNYRSSNTAHDKLSFRKNPSKVLSQNDSTTLTTRDETYQQSARGMQLHRLDIRERRLHIRMREQLS